MALSPENELEQRHTHLFPLHVSVSCGTPERPSMDLLIFKLKISALQAEAGQEVFQTLEK